MPGLIVRFKGMFHPEVEWGRVVKHYPHGVIVGLLCLNPLTWKLAQITWEVFRSYEDNEDFHESDEAWNDYLGFVFGIGSVCLGVLALFVPGLLVLARFFL